MIMEGAIVIRAQPVVDTQRSQAGQLKPPADQVRARVQAEVLTPPDQYGGMKSNHRPPRNPRGALSRRQRPRAAFLTTPVRRKPPCFVGSQFIL